MRTRCGATAAATVNAKGTIMGTVGDIQAERWDDYGDPVEAHERIAAHWTLLLGHKVTARQVALCMVQVKLAREAYSHKDDNCDDGGEYFDIAKKCAS